MDAATLRAEVHYSPETGVFTQLRANTRIKVGAQRGSVGPHGYLRVKIAGKDWYAHRLAFLYMTGNWPKEVDHINGDKQDNRWCNLRDVSHQTNQYNHKAARADNKVGLRGVTKRWNRYRATVTHGGVSRSVGCYDTAEEAHAAYLAAKQLLERKEDDIRKKGASPLST